MAIGGLNDGERRACEMAEEAYKMDGYERLSRCPS